MNATEQTVRRLLDEVLSLGGRAQSFERETPLLGAVPELDSMAVVGLLGSIEEAFGVTLDDSEIDGRTFATVGSLVDFVQAQIDR